MDHPMTQEESYADRRKIFKDIWDTALDINKNGEIIKPKAIKTLRLDEVDHSAGKRKKQRIKNIRTVCNRLLEFCDRQEAEDLQNKQILIGWKDSEDPNLRDGKKRKPKTIPKKCFRNNKVCIPVNSTAENITVVEHQTTSETGSTSRHNISPSKLKGKTQKQMNKTNAIPIRKKPIVIIINDTKNDLDKIRKTTNVIGSKCRCAKENILWPNLGKKL